MLPRTLLPLLGLLAVACVPTPYRLGVKASNEGRTFDAAKHWLDALDEDVEALKPRARLTEVGADAWNQKWSVAQEHEASGRYAESIAAYQEMFALEADLVELDLLTFPTGEAHAQHDEAVIAWAAAERAAARAAETSGDWEKADGHYRKVRELTPDATGLDLDHGAALRLWAEKDLATFRYAAAAEHFRASSELTRDPNTRAWASAVEAALGRHALAEGACRAAAGWFEKAGSVVGDTELPADRKRAEDCARVGVLVEAVSEEATLKAAATALGPMFADLLEQHIGTAGSRYVRLMAADALEAANNPPAHRVRVAGRITQAAVEAPVTVDTPRTAEGERVAECDKETARVDPDAICTEPVEVRYVEHRTSVVVRLGGSVKIVDLVTGEQQTRPLDLANEHAVLWADGFELVVEGTAIPTDVGETADIGRTAIPAEILALGQTAPPLPPEAQRVADAVKALAAEAGARVLEVVDTEAPPPEPLRLTVRNPTLLPEDVGFKSTLPVEPEGPPVIRSEPLPGPEPTPLVPPAPADGPAVPAPEVVPPPEAPVQPTPTEVP